MSIPACICSVNKISLNGPKILRLDRVLQKLGKFFFMEMLAGYPPKSLHLRKKQRV